MQYFIPSAALGCGESCRELGSIRLRHFPPAVHVQTGLSSSAPLLLLLCLCRPTAVCRCAPLIAAYSKSSIRRGRGWRLDRKLTDEEKRRRFLSQQKVTGKTFYIPRSTNKSEIQVLDHHLTKVTTVIHTFKMYSTNHAFVLLRLEN